MGEALLYFVKNFALSSPILAKFQLLRHNFSKNLFLRPQCQAKKSVPETLQLKTWVTRTYPIIFRVPSLGENFPAK